MLLKMWHWLSKTWSLVETLESRTVKPQLLVLKQKPTRNKTKVIAKSVATSGVHTETVETVPTMTRTLNESTGAHSTQNPNNNDVTQVLVEDNDCTGSTQQPLTDLIYHPI